MKAQAYSSGFRIVEKRGQFHWGGVEALLEAMRSDAESVESVPFHRHEEVFTFQDGSKLLFDHETAIGKVVT